MAIQITHIRFGSTKKTEDEIVLYRSTNIETGEVQDDRKPVLVAWVHNGGKAYVGSGAQRVSVGVMKPTDAQPYLRTHADGKWTNNLLSLPIF